MQNNEKKNTWNILYWSLPNFSKINYAWCGGCSGHMCRVSSIMPHSPVVWYGMVWYGVEAVVATCVVSPPSCRIPRRPPAGPLSGRVMKIKTGSKQINSALPRVHTLLLCTLQTLNLGCRAWPPRPQHIQPCVRRALKQNRHCLKRRTHCLNCHSK